MSFLLYLIVGACAGTLAGLFGVGGGLIIVPVLIYMFGVQGMDVTVIAHLAVGTSLATIIFTSINSMLGHHRKGAVNWLMVRYMTVGILVGAFLGQLAGYFIPGQRLQVVIGIFDLVMASRLVWALRDKKGVSETNEGERFEVPSKGWLGGAGGIVGFLSSLFGVGGGAISVPILSWKKMPMHGAVGTSAACGLPVAIFGALSAMLLGMDTPHLPAYSLGYIYLPAFIGIVITSMPFARVGVFISHRLPQIWLKGLFAFLLLLIGLDLVWHAL